ncbi:hypothetical protein BY458DRAFT_460826 [Sporodiniella umbellata]|nr:hypothetical protein BY458DRAFT_460826 [Sporodiniella umbellata]
MLDMDTPSLEGSFSEIVNTDLDSTFDCSTPIKIKKKPGRKPNPASPALRKAQNRAAQRAFRERKDKHVKELEVTIRQLREQKNHIQQELTQTKSKMDAYRAENWYLKGVMLTLQFVCLHHQINIPTHSPYLTEEALGEIATSQPHAIEAYVNAYTKNNVNLKPTMAAHFANAPNEENESQIKKETVEPEASSLSAIQRIRLELLVQSTLTDVHSTARLQPTILQLAIPHDPRIDLIPTPHMRDRMILFRDIMDYDRCFDMLLNGAVYHGGDPTMSASWELPAAFFSEFWYLAINYDLNKTNTWRRLKGLPEVGLHPKEEPHEPSWAEDVLRVAGMPTLQPLDPNYFASGFDFGTPPMVNEHDSSHERASSIGTMMDLMDSLSTGI